MRRRRLFSSSGLLDLILLIILFLLSLLFLIKLFFNNSKKPSSEVQTQTSLKPHPIIQEQPVVEPQTTLSPEVIREGLNNFRDFKKKKVYERLAQNLMDLGLTKSELTNLNDYQKGLLSQIVDKYNYNQEESNDDFAYLLNISRQVMPLMNEFKKELNLPRPKPVVDSSISSASDSKKSSDYVGVFFDVVGKIQDAALSGLKKGAAISLLPSPGLAL